MRRRLTRSLVPTSAVLLAAAGILGGSQSAGATGRPLPVDPSARAGTSQTQAAPHASTAVPDVRRNPGLKYVLSQVDADRGAEAPSLTAKCADYLGKPNPYRSIRPNVDQIHGDTTVTVGSQTGCQAAQNENTIAVNPENPKNLVAGTNDYRVFNSREQRNDGSGYAYTSMDGGKTWKDIQLPHLTYQTGGKGAFSYMDSAGDPVVAFGPHNTVYYGNIVFSRLPLTATDQGINGIALNVSHDGGLTWSEPKLLQVNGIGPDGTEVPTTVFNDKIWLAADPRGGGVYVTWTRFLFDTDGNYLESPIVLKASRDYGRTFSGRRRVDATRAGFTGGLTPYSQGSNPKVDAHGQLAIAYEGEVCPTLECLDFKDVTVVATSSDHGRTFMHHVVGTNYDFPYNEPLGTSTLTGENFRVNSFPQLDYNAKSKLFALVWSDDRNGSYDAATGASLQTNGDNIVSVSRDGRHWSHPRVVGTAQDEVFAAVGVQRGTVAVTSYTRHYDAGGVDLDYAYWAGKGGLGRGSRVHRVTTQSSDPRVQFVGLDDEGNVVQGLFIGDYTGVAFGSDGVLHPCWTDFRGRPGVNTPNQDSYTQSVRLS